MLLPNIKYSRGTHISSADSHHAPWMEPHTLVNTGYPFHAKVHVPHDPQSRPRKWENTGVYCHLDNPLPCVLGQPPVMVQGQGRRQRIEHRRWSASGLCPRGLNHPLSLETQAAMPQAGSASGQGGFQSAKGYCRSSHIPANLCYLPSNR